MEKTINKLSHSEILSQKNKHWMDLNDELLQAYKHNTIKPVITTIEAENMQNKLLKEKVINYLTEQKYLIERMIIDGDMRILDKLLNIEQSLMSLRIRYLNEYITFDPIIPVVKNLKYHTYKEVIEQYIGIHDVRMTESMAKSLLDTDKLDSIKDSYNQNVLRGTSTKENLKQFELLITGLDKVLKDYFSIENWMENQTI